jgi:hypothetical protein
VLNPDTRVAICCYQGDAPLVVDTLSLHQRHCCPITILSPENSPVLLPGLDCRAGGLAGHTGVHTLERQRRHLEILLELPENHFMIHDSDSICLDAKFPDYLYEEPEMVWSNQVNDDIPQHQATFPEGWPHVAFQPPYFLTRKTIERLLASAGQVIPSVNMMPFIDYYMLQLTMAAGLPWKRFASCVCCEPGRAKRLVRTDNISILHGIKDPRIVHNLVNERISVLAGKGGHA